MARRSPQRRTPGGSGAGAGTSRLPLSLDQSSRRGSRRALSAARGLPPGRGPDGNATVARLESGDYGA